MRYLSNTDFILYFSIGLCSNLITCFGLFLYGYCKEMPREVYKRFMRTLSLCQLCNLCMYCILSPIFEASPPSIIVLIMAEYTVNIIYLIMKYDQYTDEYRLYTLGEGILNSYSYSTSSENTDPPLLPPIRTLTIETPIPNTDEYITCSFVQYTQSKLPITVVQPDGRITLGVQTSPPETVDKT
jgi:hypothetical protein